MCWRCWLTRLPFDWTIDISYRVHCNPTAICFAANWKCHRSKSHFSICRLVACTCATIDPHICTVRPIGCFDPCIRNVRLTNSRDRSKWNSTRCRCAESVADTLRTFVWCGFAWHLQASLTPTLKRENPSAKPNHKHQNSEHQRLAHRRINSPKAAQMNSFFSIILCGCCIIWHVDEWEILFLFPCCSVALSPYSLFIGLIESKLDGILNVVFYWVDFSVSLNSFNQLIQQWTSLARCAVVLHIFRQKIRMAQKRLFNWFWNEKPKSNY